MTLRRNKTGVAAQQTESTEMFDAFDSLSSSDIKPEKMNDIRQEENDDVGAEPVIPIPTKVRNDEPVCVETARKVKEEPADYTEDMKEEFCGLQIAPPKTNKQIALTSKEVDGGANNNNENLPSVEPYLPSSGTELADVSPTNCSDRSVVDSNQNNQASASKKLNAPDANKYSRKLRDRSSLTGKKEDKEKEKAHKDHVSGTEGSEDLPNAKIQANTPITRKSSARELSAKRRKLERASSEEDDEDLESDQQEKMVLRPRRSISKKAAEAEDRSLNGSTSNKPTPARKNMKSSGQAKKIENSKYQSVRGSKSHECDTCKKLFSYPAHLERHMRIHTGEKPFKCDMCEKQFSHSGNLTNHLLVHSGDKPHKCDQCVKSFAHSSHLKIHLRQHSGEKPFKCENCEKAFPTSTHLSVHLRIHTGEKPFKCENCGQAFTHSATLISHMLLHTGEKPFKCHSCDKTFVQSSSLKTHIMYNHTHEKPWKCSRCSTKFTRWADLRMHLRTHKIMNPCRLSYVNTNVNDRTVVHVVSHVNDSVENLVLSRNASNDISGDSDVSDSAQTSAGAARPSTSKTSIEVQRNAPEVDEQDDQELLSTRDLHF